MKWEKNNTVPSRPPPAIIYYLSINHLEISFIAFGFGDKRKYFKIYSSENNWI